MSRSVRYRCSNCFCLYSHFVSGPEVSSDHTTDKWCSTCYQAVKQALKQIPRTVKQGYRYVSSPTVEELLKIEETNLQKQKEKSEGSLTVRRVYPGLIDTVHPNNKYKQGCVVVGGVSYWYEYWTHQGGPQAGRVRVDVEENLLTKEYEGLWDFNQYLPPGVLIEGEPPPFPPYQPQPES